MTILVTPVNVAIVTEALVQQLSEWAALAAVTVLRADKLNETPGRCPWLGVYRDNVEYAIGPLGFGSGFRNQRIALVVVAQAAGSSGANCEDALEALLREVVGALLTDVTLRGTVRVIEELTVRYADYREVAGGSYMQTAAVYLTAVVPVSISQV